MPYSPEYLELWTSLEFENADKKRLYSYQTFQGRDRKRQTDELFWRNSNELGIDLSGLGFVIDNNTGEIELVFDGTGDNPAEFYRWLTFTDGTNSIDAANGADVFTFEGLNDATVTVDPTNKKVSIDVSATGTLQNLIETLTSDGPGTFTASSPTDTLNVVGSNGVVTSIASNTLQITGPMSHRVFTGDTGTYSASSANSTFNILGGTGITTTVSGNNVTIENSGAQNAFTTINSDDVNTINALTPTSIFNVLGGTDITTSISGNSITIDYTGTGGASLWTEDTVSGYLYPSTLAHKVGINTNTPSDQLTVHGDVLFTQSNLATDQSLLRFEHFASPAAFTTFTIDATLPDLFQITNQFAEFQFNSQGNFYMNQYGNTVSDYALNIKVYDSLTPHDPYTTGPLGGLYIVTNDSERVPYSLMKLENTDTTEPNDFIFEITGDGGMRNTGMVPTKTPSIEGAAGATQAYLGISTTGVIKRLYQKSGTDGSSTDVWGEKSIAHGLGVTPSVVIVTKEFNLGAAIDPQTVGEQIEVVRGTINATTFDVRITDAAGSPLSNKFRTVHFIAIA